MKIEMKMKMKMKMKIIRVYYFQLWHLVLQTQVLRTEQVNESCIELT